jgi:hypothetical protein
MSPACIAQFFGSAICFSRSAFARTAPGSAAVASASAHVLPIQGLLLSFLETSR